ncbi:downstream neighbor of son [Holotrichia oblita]|uniref:Downstream neighbor of son n=1 Tax=Holotrichia oblita TaxID=644536 RepID=A0ACB9SQ85_HOLOL|nr:downstream neighbor of son [Holotrichia oblita]
MSTENDAESQENSFKWRHPHEIMKLHRLKRKKKALQARLDLKSTSSQSPNSTTSNFQNILTETKRKNPFITNHDSKRIKSDTIDAETSSDSTLFKLLHCGTDTLINKENRTSFSNILKQDKSENAIKIVGGEKWIPIDWTLKSRARFFSTKPFQWSQKLKISEEASSLTSFTRCLDISSTTTLDISPNARFHQCCLYWQFPYLPWLNLFPRTSRRAASTIVSIATNSIIKQSLQESWVDGLKSLFQLIRTKQCPYFYVCANTCTILVRAAGICGFNEMHAIITPTTRGLGSYYARKISNLNCHSTRSSVSSEGVDAVLDDGIDEDEAPDEEWLKDMGISAEDIKKINYTQAKIERKSECEVDNGEQSLTLIEGLEVQGFYNFLLNCKSITPAVGPLGGIPPTLLAPVAFRGASLNSLRIREHKIHQDNEDFYSLELTGPILPHTIHNLYNINPVENSLSATFTNVNSTTPFSKIKYKNCTEDLKLEETGSSLGRSCSSVFKKENLKDCGFSASILEQFCTENPEQVTNYDCVKYCSDTNTYSWS